MLRLLNFSSKERNQETGEDHRGKPIDFCAPPRQRCLVLHERNSNKTIAPILLD